MDFLTSYFSKFKRKIYKFLPNPRLMVGVAVAFLMFGLIIVAFPIIKKVIDNTFRAPKLVLSLLTADTSSLADDNNRTNILFLGIAGGDHEGADLTDTMIFFSINKSNADTVMLSLPRDIWIESLQAKINTAYHYGEEKQTGGGFVLAKDAVYEIVNMPIHYAALLDFQGFQKIVDLLGGIEIKVDRSFDDYKYPIAGRENDECGGDPEYKCRYESLHFEAGMQHMDGETALKFIRSRNAEGEEGTDFSRSQRQQKVITSVKDKIFDLKFFLNLNNLKELKKIINDYLIFDTQLTDEQMTAFISLLLRFVKNNNQIRTISLDIGNEENPGFLTNPPISQYDQWVLVPSTGNWQEVHRYLKDKIEKNY